LQVNQKARERAILVHVDLQRSLDSEDLNEFQELVRSTGIEALDLIKVRRTRPEARYFIGKGKIEEIQQAVRDEKADVVLFNHTLTPAQQRNIEQFLDRRVIDRNDLILDIFAQRAQSFEGKLQVELAQLRHLSTRLVRGWTHLERQKGGIGLRGPGETQLETDRRLIGKRIQRIRQQLEKVRKQRAGRRNYRKKQSIRTVSLVGYTNAGKSTLFQRLTGAPVYCADQLFATLDPVLRRVEDLGGETTILVDTVGFIRNLPHDLVAAFRATLEETREAALLLHVIDASNESHREQCAQVRRVLQEIGAQDVPLIEVYNKIDQLDHDEPRVDCDVRGNVCRVWLSARIGSGLDLLRDAVRERLVDDEAATLVDHLLMAT